MSAFGRPGLPSTPRKQEDFEASINHRKVPCDDYRPTSHRVRGNCCTPHHNTRARHSTRHTECNGTWATRRSSNHLGNLLWSLCPRDTFGSRTVADSDEIGD